MHHQRSEGQLVLNVRYQPRFLLCNYRCEYCIAGHGEVHQKADDLWDPDRFERVITNIASLPQKVNVRFGVGGEFFLNKLLVKGGAFLSRSPNVVSLNLISNLSFRHEAYKRLLADYDQSKIALVASFHPTQIPDRSEWLRTAELMNRDYDFSVALVAFPPTLDGLRGECETLKDLGIETFVQPFIGSLSGRTYPRDYTMSERDLIRKLIYSRHDFEFQLMEVKPGLCYAGSESIYVDKSGKVFSCGMGQYPEPIGDFNASPDVQLARVPQMCPFDTCSCDTENMNTVAFRRFYEHTGKNQHKYVYRYRDRAARDHRWDEWRITYE